MNQISLFDGTIPLRIETPIRLIECFAGYGSQALSLKYLNVPFEHWKIAEWAVKSIQAYKDMHFPNDNTDYSAEKSKEWLIDYLYDKGISADYNKPMKREQIARMGEEKIRTVYNNIIATHNLVSVTNVRGKDLEISDTDKYTYILTYSFPCQDLSSAGLSKGMAKGSGTRSGLLWEIERILDECDELPQILLMENVPEVIGAKNAKHFSEWFMKLESLGYKSWYKVMNAKDCEMPQNRERVFMVSALGDHYYDFPNPKPLKLRLKDLLEDKVDEKYYISDKALNGILNSNFAQATLEERIEPIRDDVGIEVVGNYHESGHDASRIVSGRGISPTVKENHGTITAVLEENDVLVWDGYNQQVRADQSCIGTLTRQCGADLKRNGQGIIEPCIIDDTYAGRDKRCYSEYAPAIRAEREGFKVFDGKTARQLDGECAGTILTNSNFTGNGVYWVQKPTDYRIRKLTPKECFRLMGVKDEELERVATNQSNSSLYHLAGDSIVTNCLMSIFKEML